MRKNRGKILLILAAVLLALYYLYPTYKDYQLQSTLRELSGPDSAAFLEEHEAEIRENRQRRIKLGLDLQGGIRVVLEVNVVKLLEDLAKNKDEVFTGIMQEVRGIAKLSEESPVDILRRKFEERQIRMSRYYGNLRDDNETIGEFLAGESEKAIDRGMEIVRNRVDQYGVSEPAIQKLGSRRIIVELPGVSKESEVRQLLQGTALLEFKLLKEAEVSLKVIEGINAYLAAQSNDSLTLKDTTAIEQLSEEEVARRNPFYTLLRFDQQTGEVYVPEENREKVRRILDRPEIRSLIPRDIEYAWSAKSHRVQDGSLLYVLYAVKKTAELTGGVVINARATLDPNYGKPIVTMEMNSEGSREWARITGANINKRVAIILDNAVFSAPVVRNKIIGGNSQIEGMDNLDEARLLEIVLKAGALPAPVDIVEQRSVGPSLGEDSIRRGLFSSALATVLTIIFMMVYYRTGGIVADGAVVFCLLFLMGVLAAFQGTLTLPGIAGIILTLAVAVDANVLIYERIREELETGKTQRAAIDAGYSKAFSAILDSNITTFMTGIILFQFGSGPVQGFALTLMIGIAASMFSAIFITRVFFTIMTEKPGATVNFG